MLFGWVIPLMGQSQDVHTWHHLGLWGMVIFVVLHVYAAIREDIMGRQSIVDDFGASDLQGMIGGMH